MPGMPNARRQVGRVVRRPCDIHGDQQRRRADQGATIRRASRIRVAGERGPCCTGFLLRRGRTLLRRRLWGHAGEIRCTHRCGKTRQLLERSTRPGPAREADRRLEPRSDSETCSEPRAPSVRYVANAAAPWLRPALRGMTKRERSRHRWLVRLFPYNVRSSVLSARCRERGRRHSSPACRAFALVRRPRRSASGRGAQRRTGTRQRGSFELTINPLDGSSRRISWSAR